MLGAPFISSDASIALMLVSAKYLNKLRTTETTLQDIIRRSAIIGIENGSQIGVGDILNNIIDEEILTLQKIDQEIIKIDKDMEQSLTSQEQSHQAECDKLLTELEQLEIEQEKQKSDILKQLANAPKDEGQQQTYKKFSEPAINVLEQKSSALSDKAFKLLLAVQHSQQKGIDKYKQLLNKIVDETKKTNLAAPDNLTSKINIDALKKRLSTKQETVTPAKFTP